MQGVLELSGTSADQFFRMDYSRFFSDDTGSFMRSPVREIFKHYDLSKIYSLAGGYPDPATFPVGKFYKIMQKVLAEHGSEAFQYGATQGLTLLREVLSHRYGQPMERIQITTSSQQGIDVCSRILLNPGDVVLTSDPSYLGAIQSFKSYRAEIVGICSLAKADGKIETLVNQGKKIKFFYSIPDFQNPSGETMTLEERQILIGLAGKYGFLIIEDCPYRELRYEGESQPTMYSLSPDRVLHLGSFSKIMAPGFRLGWIFGNPQLLDQIYVCKQGLDLCPPVFDQFVAAEFMGSGALDRNLRKSIDLYRGKRDLMLRLLEEEMPEGVSWTHPEGGLFLFLTLPEGFDAVDFYPKALEHEVAYVAGTFFCPSGGMRNTMRLNFSYLPVEKMTVAVRLLAKLLREEIA